jgi:hypothetical protein
LAGKKERGPRRSCALALIRCVCTNARPRNTAETFYDIGPQQRRDTSMVKVALTAGGDLAAPID